MTRIFQYRNPIITEMREESVPLGETRQIYQSSVVLTEIPDPINRVVVSGQGVTWVETDDNKEILNNTDAYYVNYTLGIVFFHESRNLSQINLDYYGRGQQFIPASRIYLEQEDGSVVETLQDLLEGADEFYYRGIYSPSLIYYQYNLVMWNGNSYMCVSDGASGQPPSNATYWVKISNFGFKGTYNPSTTYVNGDFVINSSLTNIYMCKAQSATGVPVTDANTWLLVIDVQSTIDSANEAIQNAEQATTDANNAADSANQAASAAITATDNANEATTNANNAATSANAAATNANDAATSANNAAGSVNTAISEAEDATTAANQAASDANTATTNANNAASAAITATSNANNATDAANQAAQDAIAATNSANQAASDATTATTNANNATDAANQAAQDAIAATNSAEQATTDANNATSAANTATTNANSAADAANAAANGANEAATNANNAADAANQATTDATNATTAANTATTLANTAATNAQNVADNTKGVGEYSAATPYEPNNIVTFNGSSYMALTDVSNVTPGTDPSKWQLVARKGVDGTGVGTVTSVTSINEDIEVTDPTSSPVLILNSSVAATPNSIVKRDENGIVSEIGDLGTLSTVDKSNVVSAINELNSQLSEADPIGISLTQGTQIIDAVEDSMVQFNGMKGRTLVNLLGSAGGFEVSQWDANMEYETTTFVSGTHSGKIDNTSASGNVPKTSYLVDSSSAPRRFYLNGKYLLLAMYARAGIAGMPEVEFTVQAKDASGTVLTTQFSRVTINTSWALYSQTFNFTSTSADHYEVSISCRTSGSSAMAYFDDVALYEIASSERTYIDSLPPPLRTTYIAQKYPYVDSMQSVFNPYVIAEGKNLLPPFTEWTLDEDAVISNPYELILNSSGRGQSSSVTLRVSRDQDYTYSFIPGAEATIRILGRVFGAPVQTTLVPISSTTSGTFNSGDNDEIEVIFSTDVSGIITFTNPILSVGSEEQPFEPQQRSYKFWQTTLRSNVDGSAADELYVDEDGNEGALRKQSFRVLDGSLGWEYDTSYTDSKRVALRDTLAAAVSSSPSGNGALVKYDGKILNPVNTFAGTLGDDWGFTSASGYTEIFMSVKNSDSGWGPDYSPSDDEVKAYFYGWRMYTLNSSHRTSVYNNSGTKAWYPIQLIPNEYPFDSGLVMQTVPIAPANTSVPYTPYTLQYQLADPVSEPVESEGEVMLHEGLNQLTLGAGVIVREAAKSALVSGQYIINSRNTGENYLEHRASEILQVYKNNDADNEWELFVGGSTVSYGPAWARIPETLFDPTAAYSVTYFALDMYKLGFAPMEITGAYEGNLNEVVNQHTRTLTNYGTRLSVVENEYARKQQGGWISPTLLNGWVIYNTTKGMKYRIDDFGELEFVGAIRDGVNATLTTLFYLPEGYRPNIGKLVGVYNTTSGGGANGNAGVEILTTGEVRFVGDTAPGRIYFDGIRIPLKD